MGILEIILVYLSGVISGVIVAMGFVLYVGQRSMKKSIEKKKTELDGLKSINERLSKVKELTEQQLNLQSGAEGPQKNALHGRYKNGLGQEIEFLEEQKVEILKSIVKDGFDPEISTMGHDGVITKGKLSAFLTERGISLDDAPTEKENPRSKFTVYRGGKGDGGETVH